MMVRVVYNDDSFDVVKASQLDDLIIAGKVVRFLRAEGWVTVGRDPIRIYTRIFKGSDRRSFGLGGEKDRKAPARSPAR
jgi:hypothetical protein